MEDNQIVDLYFAREEQAVAETDRKYGSYCFSLAHRILQSVPDAEETVSDTYLKTWNAIPPKRPEVLRLFLAKITRNLAFTRWRKSRAEKRGGGELTLVLEELEGCVSDRRAIDDRLNAKELERAVRSFLDTLPERDQDIFLRRYFFVEETEDIAQRYRLKPGHRPQKAEPGVGKSCAYF